MKQDHFHFTIKILVLESNCIQIVVSFKILNDVALNANTFKFVISNLPYKMDLSQKLRLHVHKVRTYYIRHCASISEPPIRQSIAKINTVPWQACLSQAPA